MFKNEKGQAAVILAIAIVALLAFAALAIDAGSLYNQRRAAQNAADAAALAGTRQLVLECGQLGQDPGPSAASILDQVTQMMSANAPGATVQATYLDANGQAMGTVDPTMPCPCSCDLGGSRATGIRTTVNGKVQSFLAGLVGQPELNTSATASARFGVVKSVTTGLYPFTRRNIPINTGEMVELRIVDNADTLPGSFGWLTWDGQNNTQALCDSLADDGNSEIYFNPGTPDNGWTADHNDHAIEVGKWVQGAPGNKNGNCVDEWLDWHIANKTAMIIPLYDEVAEQGSHANYKVASFAAFEIQSYNLPPGQGGFITGKFLNWVTNAPIVPAVSCQEEGTIYSVRLSE